MGQITKRVFIIPVGLEPYIAKYTEVSPDHVYLITQHQDPSRDLFDGARQNVEEVFEHFKYANPVVFGVENYFNLFEIMSVIRHICDTHPNDAIFINVSSGSKLTAIAGFIVSNWYGYANCYYPRTKITVNRPNELYAENEVAGMEMIQPFPIKRLDPMMVPVINFLWPNPKTKKEILGKLIELEHIEETFEDNQGGLRERSPQSLYNLLKRNYLTPLEDELLIGENNSGEVELTELGRNFRIIFAKEADEYHYENI